LERDAHPIRALLLAAETVKVGRDPDGGPGHSGIEDWLQFLGDKPARGLRPLAEALLEPLLPVRLGGPETVLREMISSTGGTPLRGGPTLAFDPQGRWLATRGSDGTVSLWDLRNPKAPSVETPGKSRVEKLVFDSQGNRSVAHFRS